MAEELAKTPPKGEPPGAAAGSDAGGLDPAELEFERDRLRLSIHGGIADERFDLELEAMSDGRIVCDLVCSMSDRRVEKAELRMEPGRLSKILEVIDVPRLATVAVRQGGFPPCSLIGRLDLERRGERVATFFMADREQARNAGLEPPAEVTRAVEMLYEEAEKMLGLESVRP